MVNTGVRYIFEAGKKDRFDLPAWQKSSKPFNQRKKFSGGNAYRPESIISRARYNSRVLNQLRNKPSAGKRRPGFKNTAAIDKGRPVSLAFSMPLLPVMGFLLLGTFFIIDNRASLSAMLSRDVIPAPGLDAGGKINMAAFVNNTGALAGQPVNLIEPETASESAPEASPAASSAVSSAAASLAEPNFAETAEEHIPLKMVEYFAWESYTVKRGDSVSSIAAEHGLSMDAIIASNNLSNAHLLGIGQILRIPNINGIPYVVKKGDTLSGISKSYNIPLEVMVDVNNIQQDLIIPGQNIFLPGARMPVMDLRMAIGTYFISPLKGSSPRLSSAYGWREDPFGGGQRLHEAVDMAISTGTTVKAAADGKVSFVGNSPVYGKYIILGHTDNLQTLYAHLSVQSVKQGDTVEQGVKIGEVGSTGQSTGPHLHFAVYKNGHAVNPLDYFSM